jgi:hypothetical protein
MRLTGKHVPDLLNRQLPANFQALACAREPDGKLLASSSRGNEMSLEEGVAVRVNTDRFPWAGVVPIGLAVRTYRLR